MFELFNHNDFLNESIISLLNVLRAARCTSIVHAAEDSPISDLEYRNQPLWESLFTKQTWRATISRNNSYSIDKKRSKLTSNSDTRWAHNALRKEKSKYSWHSDLNQTQLYFIYESFCLNRTQRCTKKTSFAKISNGQSSTGDSENEKFSDKSPKYHFSRVQSRLQVHTSFAYRYVILSRWAYSVWCAFALLSDR